MTIAIAYLAGIGTAAAFRWVRPHHIANVWWLLRTAPAIVSAVAMDE